MGDLLAFAWRCGVLVIFGVPSAEFFRDGKKKSRNCGAGSSGTVGCLKGLVGDGLGELG